MTKIINKRVPIEKLRWLTTIKHLTLREIENLVLWYDHPDRILRENPEGYDAVTHACVVEIEKYLGKQ